MHAATWREIYPQSGWRDDYDDDGISNAAKKVAA